MKEYCAKMLHGSVRMVSADEYHDSGDGFITAVWIHDGSKLDTEIPASQLQGKQVMRPGPVAVAAAVENPKVAVAEVQTVGEKAVGKSAKAAEEGTKKKGKPKTKPKAKTAGKNKWMRSLHIHMLQTLRSLRHRSLKRKRTTESLLGIGT